MLPERKIFQSSHLHYAEYDREAGSLTVAFNNGRVYQSQVLVPGDVWHDFKRADNPVNFFRSSIVPYWQGEEIT